MKKSEVKLISQCSVADPGCLSRIPDPDFYPSRIPDLGSRIQKQQQKREVKKIRCQTFLCSHKFNKIVNYFSFEVLKKKIWPNFQRIIELFTKKIVKKLFTIWSWDPGSGIRDPGSRKNHSGSQIRIRNTVAMHRKINVGTYMYRIHIIIQHMQKYSGNLNISRILSRPFT
jgi:hypothetical protein